jgi:hypothetical protein
MGESERSRDLDQIIPEIFASQAILQQLDREGTAKMKIQEHPLASNSPLSFREGQTFWLINNKKYVPDKDDPTEIVKAQVVVKAVEAAEHNQHGEPQSELTLELISN